MMCVVTSINLTFLAATFTRYYHREPIVVKLVYSAVNGLVIYEFGVIVQLGKYNEEII
jgi:hypothetical protein